MANTKITDLTALTAPVGSDLVYIVDVSDTSDDPSGSSFKVTVTDLLREGIENVLLAGAHSMLYCNGSTVASRLDVSERTALMRGGSGTIVAGTGRSLLDEVVVGDTTSETSANNYQPHYYNLWNGTNGDLDTTTLTWPMSGSNLGAVSVYHDPTADTTAVINLPAASASLAGDRLFVFNRKADATSGYVEVRSSTGGSGSMVDEDTQNQGWRLHYGDFVGFECKLDETTSTYEWYQCAGTPLEERYERFETSGSLTFGNGTQYTPGKAHIDVTADGQTITLPSASAGRRYQYAIRNYNSGITFTTGTTVAAAGADTITWDPSDTGNTQAVITSGTHAFTRLETRGDGVWYEMYQSGTVTYS